MVEMRNAYKILIGKPRDHSEDLGVDWKLTVKEDVDRINLAHDRAGGELLRTRQ
jgi:hypothetical protein